MWLELNAWVQSLWLSLCPYACYGLMALWDRLYVWLLFGVLFLPMGMMGCFKGVTISDMQRLDSLATYYIIVIVIVVVAAAFAIIVYCILWNLDIQTLFSL